MIDLHLHTNLSDGTDTPLELIEKIELSNCKLFSVTDHDDLRANAVIISARKTKPYFAKFIIGTEISSVFEGRNLHLLCYGFNPFDENIIEMICEVSKRRHERIKALFDHLRIKHGIIIPDEDKVEILNRDIPGKVHIASAAMKLGIKMSRQAFFDNCLDDMESREHKLEAANVINTVTTAGGVVSFAHPIEVQKEYRIDISEISLMTKRLKGIGLVGIEVFHSLHDKSEVHEYGKIAKKCSLLVSGGSDYHGENKNVEIGQLNNFGYMPEDEEITLLNLFCHQK